MSPDDAQRRAALAAKACPWTLPPESTRRPTAPSTPRPIGGNVATKRKPAKA